MTIVNDIEKQKVIQLYNNGEFSPRLYKFLKGLDSRKTDNCVDFGLLESYGLRLSDETIFRIMGSQRSYEAQHEQYKRGRQLQTVESANNEGGIRYNIISEKVIDANSISTKAQAGKSFHNYGLAVDICFRRLGDNLTEWKNFLNERPSIFGSYVYDLATVKRAIRRFFEVVGLKKWAEKCGVVLGVDWDFFDLVHVEDSKGVKLPAVPYSNMCSYKYLFPTEAEKAIKGVENNGQGETNSTKIVSCSALCLFVGLAIAFTRLAFN